MPTRPLGIKDSPEIPKPVSASRREAVDRARKSWIQKLIDLSRRNNLLYYRPLKTGTLDLSSADSAGMTALLSGVETVSMAKLVSNGNGESVTRLLREISRRAQANEEEKGLQTLFIALGMATWTADDGGRPSSAPVLLFPVKLENKGSQSFTIMRAGAIQLNLVLLHVLDTQFGVKLESEGLIASLAGEDGAEALDPQPVYDQLKSRASEVPGFDIKVGAILGNFAFQKMAMVKDLQDRAEELAKHDVVAAIAGDTEARIAVGASQTDLEPRELDRVLPDNEFIVLDADSSQQCAIGNILAGQNAVIHGPPGTGKSQTIANLIATLAATGHRVLFVAEKRAALEVVLRRLRGVGLGHLAIDLHGADLSPKKVMQQVADSLDKVRNAVPADAESTHKQLVDRRARLNDHVDRIHKKREPTRLSVYEMQGRLVRLNSTVRASTRWRGEELARLTPDAADRVHDLLTEAAGFGSLFLRDDPSPWTGAQLPDGETVAHALDIAQRTHASVLPAFLSSLNELLKETGLMWPTSLAAARELIDVAAAVQETLADYSSEIYAQDHAWLIHVLEKGQSGRFAAAWLWLTKSEYRRARKLVRSLRTAGPAPVGVLTEEIKTVRLQLESWAKYGGTGTRPLAVTGFAELKKRCDELFSDAEALGLVLPNLQFGRLSLDEFGALMGRLASDVSTPHQIPKLTRIERGLEDVGVARLVSEIRSKTPPRQLWFELFQYCWFISTLDALSAKDPEIRGFRGSTHGGFVDDFMHLDEQRVVLASERVRRAHGLHAVEVMNAHPGQQHLIRAEAAKGRKHLPLRRTFAQAAEVLTAVCPCWMASPLSVSQLLDGGKQYFDFVIFDEASQVLPEDAVSAVLRGKQLVVAGDNHQLPPTTFFAASEEDEYSADEETGAAEGYQSLLEMMIPFVRSCYLNWHYRSRDEALINFSNRYIYGDRLVTFPGPGGPPVIRHELVNQESGIDGQEESSGAEVRRVIDLIFQHARQSPQETLGVITMGIKHMNRVQAALDREIDQLPELAAFFDPNMPERFFVKNLERVQGDERDAIIISIGYGKDRAGNLPLRFGPLLPEAGCRRLNVAVTRARQRITVVSSFSHNDIDLARVRAGSGVEMLRNYLQYAASSGRRLGDGQLTSTPLNEFETDVFDVLTGQGINLIPQLGASKYRIDMVAQHPAKPGRFVLAIECDGASYHSSPTARDRDRLRQRQLENLGWRFHRIWSTDWFMRKEDEVKRTLAAFSEAVDYADKLDAGPNQNRPDQVSGANGHNTAHLTSRASRPTIPARPSITQYDVSELVELIRWVNSDGQLRTDDEITEEMVSVLGFNRRGARIEAAISSALRNYRSLR